MLEEYEGTVFLVSHDRMFLDNVVTQVIASEGNGVWREYVGGYSDWERQRPAQTSAGAKAAAKAADKNEVKAESTMAAPAAAPAPAKKKLSYKEQRELEELPKRIAALEAEQKELSAKLADPDLYKKGADEAVKLNQRFAEIDEELLVSLERWEEIEGKQ